MPPLARFAAASLAASALAASAAQAQDVPRVAAATAISIPGANTIRPQCEGGKCGYRMSAPQLLALAEKLVLERKFDEARPLVAALNAAPGMELPYNFLEGLMAMGTGDAPAAEVRFRTILKDHPGQTRVRLELAKALMMQGKLSGADYQLRLAESDETLPEDVARIISNARSVIRSNRKFRYGFEVGLAPDTNINSATSAETVDVNFGASRVPLELNEDARARSGMGVTADAYASLRLPVSESVSIIADSSVAMVNYAGGDYDDYTAQLAAGPELQLSQATQVSLEAVGLYRWYGGEVAARQYGSRLTLQHDLAPTKRIAFQIDGRRTESDLSSGYTGWQIGANASYEQVIDKSAILSASLYARRDIMELDAYSSKTAGVSLGIGGELPLGINAGLSGGVSYSRYDAPQYVFSFDKRVDWRFNARAYVGLRQIRVAGFSPSVEYRFLKVDSNYDLYASTRHRFEFSLARYF
ncbi:MAG TPA: surface lipoprotein assembly modifier [Novosphingobium sp.]|nr:surface lipoprotein assembly modifier [Novosphingobium sp.]